MSKNKTDDTKKISTSFLKKHGYFHGWRAGTITWTRSGRWGESESSVGIVISTLEGDNYLHITYTQTDRDTNEKRDFDYKIPLTTTPCRYGGKRYWFVCPWHKNGVYCGKRVGKLYMGGDYFACRHCYELTYDSRNLSGWAKRFGSVVSEPELDRLWDGLKLLYYKGKPTKKYKSFLKKAKKAERSWIGMATVFDERIKKIRKSR